MNILIIILIILGAIIITILVAAAFLKDEYIIEREIIIDRPNQKVYDYIKYLKNSEKFNKWVMTDPNMKKEYNGIDGTIGFIYTWDSENKNVGKGEQEIKKLIEGKKVDYEIRFIKPFTGLSQSYFTLEQNGPDKTKIIWLFKGFRNYMMKLIHLVFKLGKILGNDMQTSLVNLKRILEAH